MNFKSIQIFGGVSFVEKLLFTKHLLVMTKSGINFSEAIETIAAQTKSAKFRSILEDVNRDIRNGKSLEKSLAKHPDVFNQFYVSLIGIGEESGTLDTSLEYLTKQLAEEYSLRKKVQSALLYPTIVLIAVVIVGTGMSFFVLPNLVELFESLDVDLPITTKILLFFANLMKNHGLLVILAIITSAILLRIFITLPYVRPTWDRVILSFPVIGQLFRYREQSLMCRNLGIMLKSGLSITKALNVEYAACGNYVFKDYIKRIEKSVDKGKEVSAELGSGNYSKFSPIAIKMIAVGEKSGQLDESFLYLSNFFDDEVDDITKNLPVVLEPIILLGIGLVVGFVALAIISPIYEFTGSIRR